jgi:hypothetical protein
MLVPTCNQRLLLCSGSIEDWRKACCESVPDAHRWKGSGRPVSRILLYPAIHLREQRSYSRAPLEEPRLPVGRLSATATIWLARTGGLPGRSLRLAKGWPWDTAGGLLPHPFTHHLCRGASPRPSAGLLSVALDVTGALRPPPLGLLARAASATSPDFSLRPAVSRRSAATGRTARTLPELYLTRRGGPWSGHRGRRRAESARSWSA